MIAIFLAPVYILLNVYLARWVLRWTGACHHLCGTKAFRAVFIVLYALVASAPLTGFLVQSPYPLRQFLRQVGNYWFGWMLYLVLAVLAVELALFVIRRVRAKISSRCSRCGACRAVSRLYWCAWSVFTAWRMPNGCM